MDYTALFIQLLDLKRYSYFQNPSPSRPVLSNQWWCFYPYLVWPLVALSPWFYTRPNPSIPFTNELHTVNSLFNSSTTGWDTLKVSSFFDSASSKAILPLKVVPTTSPDKLLWLHNNKGIYTVKSGYHHITNYTTWSSQNLSQTEWNQLWNLNIHNRWNYSSGSLLGTSYLQLRRSLPSALSRPLKLFPTPAKSAKKSKLRISVICFWSVDWQNLSGYTAPGPSTQL